MLTTSAGIGINVDVHCSKCKTAMFFYIFVNANNNLSCLNADIRIVINWMCRLDKFNCMAV